MKLPKIEEMLKSGMHFGHNKSKWHPKMKKFIFDCRKGVYIIDLVKAQKSLENALNFLENLASEGKTVLFVGTKNQVKKPLKEMATELGMPYVVEKWLGGTLTNFAVIKKIIKKYTTLTEEKKQGKLQKYTKKERLNFDREIDKLEKKVGGLVTLNKIPDVLFVWDIKKEKTAIIEAKKKNIPTIAICDTNTNPDLINYPIPGNDDATKTITLILSSVKETIKNAKTSSKTPLEKKV